MARRRGPRQPRRDRPACDGRRLHGVVGLCAADGQHVRRALRQGVGHEEFQLADLVPAEGQAGQVVALEPDRRPTQRLRQPLGLHEGRRQDCKP